MNEKMWQVFYGSAAVLCEYFHCYTNLYVSVDRKRESTEWYWLMCVCVWLFFAHAFPTYSLFTLLIFIHKHIHILLTAARWISYSPYMSRNIVSENKLSCLVVRMALKTWLYLMFFVVYRWCFAFRDSSHEKFYFSQWIRRRCGMRVIETYYTNQWSDHRQMVLKSNET